MHRPGHTHSLIGATITFHRHEIPTLVSDAVKQRHIQFRDGMGQGETNLLYYSRIYLQWEVISFPLVPFLTCIFNLWLMIAVTVST